MSDIIDQFWDDAQTRETFRREWVDVDGTVSERDAFRAWVLFKVTGKLPAQGIAAGTDETRNAAQPEGQEPGPKDAPSPSPSPAAGR